MESSSSTLYIPLTCASLCRLYLEQDVSLPDEVVRKYSDVALGRINTAIKELRRLFLVEDLVDSLKVRLSKIFHVRERRETNLSQDPFKYIHMHEQTSIYGHIDDLISFY